MEMPCTGVQIGSQAAVPTIPSRIADFQEGGGQALVIDPEMGKG